MSALHAAAALPVPGVDVVHRDVDLEARGLRVHVAEAGDADAPPLILLHGWPQHWWEWRKVLGPLAEDFRVLCPDLRGLGWTSAPASGYEKEELATDLLALLDALDLPRVAMAGHDWGGWVGFLAALRAPARFSGLLAVSIPHPFPKPTRALLAGAVAGSYVPFLAAPGVGASLVGSGWAVRRIFETTVGDREIWAPGEVDAYVERFTSDPDRVHASVQYYRRFLLHESPGIARGRYRARDLQVPTHMLMGERDAFAHGSLFGSRSPQMTDELVPGVGHFVPEAAPELLVARVRERLR
jgi:pimeloyl-ACP methyl ester carboxylesterase